MTTVIETTAAPLVKYNITDARIAELRSEFTGLTADTPKGYEAVRVAIATVRDIRVGVEKRRKELKEDSLAWGRKVDSEAKRLTALLEEIENPLKEAKALVDEAKERAKREAEEKARKAEEERLAALKAAEEARLKAEREAEEARIAAERERLAAERAEFEAQQAALAEERKALDAEKERLAAAERAKIEQARKEQEEAERLARIEALRPDAVKLTEYGFRLLNVDHPDVESDEAKQILKQARDGIHKICDLLDSLGK